MMTSASPACDWIRGLCGRDSRSAQVNSACPAPDTTLDRAIGTRPPAHDVHTAVRITRKSGLAGMLFLAVALVSGCPLPPPLPGSAAPFIGPRDFSGTYTPRWRDATTGGEATYHGNIVFTNLDRDIVQGALPPHLQLAENTLIPHMHPVIFLFGHPMNTHWVVADTPMLVGSDYQELMLLIPFVHSTTGTKWHTYVARMYLDDVTAIAIGNLFFGYAKAPGTAWESGTQVTEFFAGFPYFHANIQPIGPWTSSTQAETTFPNYKAIQTILDMPIVGRTPGGILICSYFELHYQNATVAPVESRHEFLQPFRPGMSAWVALGTLESVPGGALAIRNLTWRIRQPPPPPCHF
jgi:hypothetical protein